MKMGMIYLDKFCKNNDLTLKEVRKVGDFHDEAQHEVINDEKYIELFSSLCCLSLSSSGKFFKLRCPLEAEVKRGLNWSQTH